MQTNQNDRLELKCGEIPDFDPASWDSIEAAFAGAQACVSRQYWQPVTDTGFRPMTIRTGWRNGELAVYAVLKDDDIFNPATKLNEFGFMVGDVFEMFLRPVDQDPYFEFHVSPENQKLQIRFPSAEVLRQRKGPPDERWFISDRQIGSQVLLEPVLKQWRVLARIPFDMVAEKSETQPGSRWLFSFSRYDYTRGQNQPVYSSTSPHVKLSFHIQEDWGTLVFE